MLLILLVECDVTRKNWVSRRASGQSGGLVSEEMNGEGKDG
jgi:hypothetical protein